MRSSRSAREAEAATVSDDVVKQELTLSNVPAPLANLGLKYLEHDALRARFKSYDVNGDGRIDTTEARHVL